MAQNAQAPTLVLVTFTMPTPFMEEAINGPFQTFCGQAAASINHSGKRRRVRQIVDV
jgi:hypothetical protein